MVFDLLLTFFLVLLNGFFVAAEFAIVKVRFSKIELLANEGNRQAKLARQMIQHLDAYLSATQLGITLASLGLGWIGESVVSQIIINLMNAMGFDPNPELAHNIALPIAFILITILHIVFGELAPKSLAIQRSEGTTLAVAYPLNVFYFIFKPIIWLLNGFANFILKLMGISPASEHEVHSPEELRYLIEQGNESGNMKKLNYDIIKNAFDFSGRTVKQIMIPRIRFTALNIEETGDEQLEKLIDDGFSRIPVYKDSIDNIIGILYIKDLLNEMRKQVPIDIQSLMKPATVVPESKKIADLLHDFQEKHIHMAIVLNEYGGTEGLLTMEDILEELVGEIQDEYDQELPFLEETAEGTFKILASASILDINEKLGIQLPESNDYESLGGLIIYKLGRIPNIEEKIKVGSNEIKILKKNRHKIILVQLKKILKKEDGNERKN